MGGVAAERRFCRVKPDDNTPLAKFSAYR